MFNDHQKNLDSLVKELVRTERIDDAKIVQETLDHFGQPRIIATAPKRITTPALPVFRQTLQLDEQGKLFFSIQRTTTAMQPDAGFPGTSFPLSTFPKAQAFRGKNGLGRVFFDFR